MKTKSRLPALLLCLCMIITLFPMTALAANTAGSARDITFELAMASDLKELGLFEGVGANTVTLSRPLGVRVVPISVR